MNQFGKISELRLTAVENSKDKTIIKDSFFTSPFKIMKPFDRKDGRGIMVLVQTASAGIMAGDVQNEVFVIEDNAILEVKSQSFEKIFKMDNNEKATRSISVSVGHNSCFIYAPQPCMPFSCSDFISHTKVSLKDNSSRLVYEDCICAGRVAHEEAFDYRSYHNLIEVEQQGSLIYRDNTILEGSDGGLKQHNKEVLLTDVMFGEYTHLGTMLIFNFDLQSSHINRILGLNQKLLYTQDTLKNIKDISAPLIGVSKAGENCIAVKVLSHHAQEVQNIFSMIKDSLNF